MWKRDSLSAAHARAVDYYTNAKFDVRRLLEHLVIDECDATTVEEKYLAVRGLPRKNNVKISSGTIVDATIISAPSSTKNATGERDPEMRQTKKGNQWYFGMKAHTGVDSKAGIMHSIAATGANVHDSEVLPHLMHGKERRLYGDSAYRGQRDVIRSRSKHARDFTNKRAYRNTPLSEADLAANQTP